MSSHPVALALREHIVFKVLPMLNPDGVFLGNYRYTSIFFLPKQHRQRQTSDLKYAALVTRL
jgi:cytosolic carboxypeptidase protein 6